MHSKLQLSVVVLLAGLSAAQVTRSAFPSNPLDRDPVNVFLFGRVVTDDGAPPSSARIVTRCDGQISERAQADQKGTFSIHLGAPAGIGAMNLNEASEQAALSFGEPKWNDCEVWAELEGYTSEHVRLSLAGQPRSLNAGVLLLRRSPATQDFMISVNTAAAPKEAKKALEQGQKEARKGKWAAACEKFRSAIAKYPKYAFAWLELGRVQVHQNDFLSARDSFQAAVEADPKLVGSYAELAQLALEGKNWEEVAKNTEQLLQLDPVHYPQYWLLSSVAHYNLHNVEQAEDSARRGLLADSQHRVLYLEYWLGALLGLKRDYAGATEHMRNYLQRSPDGPAAGYAREYLARYEKLGNLTAAEHP